jgi:tRNA-binding protein|tara:strand:+ start:384 stop:707 length:324 start_codon:yes stop_codon:yes gene_type:complete
MSISYDDFKKLDLRVAKILKIEKIPGKTKIVKGEIDLGDETRNVIIGGAEFYEPDDLVGKTVIVVANLEPKKMAGVESNAMLLAADINDKPFWLTVDSEVPSGTMIK